MPRTLVSRPNYIFIYFCNSYFGALGVESPHGGASNTNQTDDGTDRHRMDDDATDGQTEDGPRQTGRTGYIVSYRSFFVDDVFIHSEFTKRLVDAVRRGAHTRDDHTNAGKATRGAAALPRLSVSSNRRGEAFRRTISTKRLVH